MATMEIVKQRDRSDCGVCAIAIATGNTYERVCKSVPPDVGLYGLWVPEVLHALKKITRQDWATLYSSNNRAFFRFYEVKEAIYGLYSADGDFHYLYSDGRYIYDSLRAEPVLFGSDEFLKHYENHTVYVEIFLPVNYERREY